MSEQKKLCPTMYAAVNNNVPGADFEWLCAKDSCAWWTGNSCAITACAYWLEEIFHKKEGH